MMNANDDREHDLHWAALISRSASNAQPVLYAVTTTGIYCRIGCPSRRPLRRHVAFYDTPARAENEGYRACLRCRPNQSTTQQVMATKVAEACNRIKTSEAEPSLEQLADDSEMRVFHFQRCFKSIVGITPKTYFKAIQMERMRNNLRNSNASITSAIYEAGFTSSSRFYETATRSLGMTAKQFRLGGINVRIIFAISECSLGLALVASSSSGVCAIILGDDRDNLLGGLEQRFPKAKLVGGDRAFEHLIAHAVRLVDLPKGNFDLPIDLRKTAFQQKVWQALRKMPIVHANGPTMVN